MRSNAQDLNDDAKRRRFKLRLAATIRLAQQQRFRRTVQILSRLDAQTTEAALRAQRVALLIDQELAEAAMALPSAP